MVLLSSSRLFCREVCRKSDEPPSEAGTAGGDTSTKLQLWRSRGHAGRSFLRDEDGKNPCSIFMLTEGAADNMCADGNG
jgi:hypothetical protein